VSPRFASIARQLLWWVPVCVLLVLWLAGRPAVIYDGWNQQFEIMRGPPREDGVVVQIPLLLPAIPLAYLALRRTRRMN
jgi:hypothetical protein